MNDFALYTIKQTHYRKPRSGRVLPKRTYPGNSRIKFCSSLSSTSSTKYWKYSGNRGLTEKASFASRMHTLRLPCDNIECARVRWAEEALAHICVIRRPCRISRDFEA